MLQDSQAAAKFIDTLIDAKLAGTEIEPEVHQTLHRNLLERLENQITHAIVSLLNQQQQLELEHLIDSHQADKIEDYLKKHEIDLNQVLAGVMTEFQATYLGA
jgi:glycerol-3-phosphate responsive antiterminator